MRPFRAPIFFLFAALMIPPAGARAQYDLHLHVPEKSFSTLGLPLATGRVNGLAADGANRVWVSTPNGISALAPAAGANPAQPATLFGRATFFPFRQTDGLLSDTATAVTFAQIGNDEYFFAGFTTGLQYGRVLSTSGLSLPQDATLFQGQDDAQHVNDLASAGTQRVWVATNAGLREWDVSGQAPQETTDSPYSDGDTVAAVAVAPGSPTTAAYLAGGQVLLVDSGGSPVALDTPGATGDLIDLLYDDQGNLWVLGEDKVWQYAASNLTDPQSAAPSFETAVPDGLVPHALGFDAVEQALWLAAGTDGAWFAVWDGTSLSEWAQVLDGGTPVPSSTKNTFQVFADPAGNIWFGTDGGVEALVARFLSIDSTRYLGFGTTARVIVLDVAAAGSGAIQVQVNGEDKEVPETENPGVFSRTLRFSETAGPDAIQVSSTAEDTPIEFRYEYDANRALVARASWANIEDFEDDLWIGGPCFLEVLGR
ncbi:hypothetical protein [Deferrisoma palaeochoriense]